MGVVALAALGTFCRRRVAARCGLVAPWELGSWDVQVGGDGLGIAPLQRCGQALEAVVVGGGLLLLTR